MTDKKVVILRGHVNGLACWHHSRLLSTILETAAHSHLVSSSIKGCKLPFSHETIRFMVVLLESDVGTLVDAIRAALDLRGNSYDGCVGETGHNWFMFSRTIGSDLLRN